MHMRVVSLLIALVLAMTVWAKPKFDPQTIIQRSDAVYYFPQDHGLTDVAVDLSVAQFSADSVAGKATITFGYDGTRRELVLGNIPEVYKQVRDSLLNALAPIGEYVVPKKSAENFTGMTLSAVQVYRQLAGRPDARYYLIYGVVNDAQAPLKEYRVLVDEQGLAHQVETESRQGGVITARLENAQVGEAWVVGKISTRLASASGPVWEIATVTYETVEGFVLPVQVQTLHRNTFNQPIKEMPDLTIRLSNYRINAGAAAALLPPPPVPAPAPAEK